MDFSFSWAPVFQLFLAAVLGGVVGIERDINGHPAGIRTNIIIALGSCLFTIISSEGFVDAAGSRDPTRIASIVVQGIGFIGAGVMLKGNDHVTGLTTAATIWMVAAIGMAVGAGMPMLAIVGTVFAVMFLVMLQPFSHTLERIGERRNGKNAAVKKRRGT
jgi:putative Mg2+ transporter-C (MgtC) family protein